MVRTTQRILKSNHYTSSSESQKQLKQKPFFIAGGLTQANVTEAIQFFEPFAVDVSSSVETDGVKDVTKIKAFIKAVKEQ